MAFIVYPIVGDATGSLIRYSTIIDYTINLNFEEKSRRATRGVECV
jgi:hypothetical protein